MYTPRGLLWLVTVVATVSGWAIALALGAVESLLESELSHMWKSFLLFVFAVIIVTSVAISVAKTLKARSLARYCTDCVAAMTAGSSLGADEYGPHKIRMKK